MDVVNASATANHKGHVFVRDKSNSAPQFPQVHFTTFRTQFPWSTQYIENLPEEDPPKKKDALRNRNSTTLSFIFITIIIITLW